jgi:replicative DNA helicase
VELVQRGEFDKVERYIKEAVEIGVNEDGGAYDYYSNISLRTSKRIDDASGVKPARGITTGHLKLDEILYHRGWGRKELATIMGGAKSGKTTALIGFAKAASLAKFNVLYVTLEVSSEIISERLDASVSDTMIKELSKHIKDVEVKVDAMSRSAGKLILHEYPSGTFSPKMLRALLDRYEAKGQRFDLVVVDYADIMAPNHRYEDVIENSKSIYVDLRAIAQEKDVAMLTATQTNREGYKATVAKAEHVAEDFNKVRTVDLMISINITDEERSKGEARLYFAASRNQESGFTLFIKQDISKMKFIESIVRRE